MNWIARFFRSTPELTAGEMHALREWCALPAPHLRQPLFSARLVVVDVETSGLDIHRDRLISIGGLAVEAGVIDMAQSFEVILRQDAPSSTQNILVHGISGTQQRGGVDPAGGLLSFLRFAKKDPLVAFNADFDRAMIERALQTVLGVRSAQTWLDLAVIAPAVLTKRAPRAKSLDEWCAATGIPNYARHNAVADALATAQLLLVALDAAVSQRITTVAQLIKTERAQRWLALAHGSMPRL